MATIVAMAPVMHSRTATPPPHLTLNTSSRGTPAAVPNKHIPHCTPGPRPVQVPDTPPTSPPRDATIETAFALDPDNHFTRILSEPPVYSVNASTVVQALEHYATQPLPDPKLVFPWLHGLHADNQMQLGFFVAKQQALRKVPKCLRGITIVKAGGDLTRSKLKGAIAPEELLMLPNEESGPEFIECDPREGFSVRNFQIQACKMATVSDIVVYGDDATTKEDVVELAKQIALAQLAWRAKMRSRRNDLPVLSTFVVLGMHPLLPSLSRPFTDLSQDSFSIFEEQHNEIVAIDSNGIGKTDSVMDFCK
jgi:dual specificity MAP kinase phosphatase